MKRYLVPALLGLVLIVAGAWAWSFFFPSPQRVIRKNMAELARAGSVAPVEGPLAQLANAQKVTTFFANDVQIAVEVPGYSRYRLEGMDDLLRAAVAARQQLPGLQIEFPDVNVSVLPGKATATAEVTIRGKTPGDPGFLVQELKVGFRKVGRRWLIDRIETVRTLH